MKNKTPQEHLNDVKKDIKQWEKKLDTIVSKLSASTTDDNDGIIDEVIEQLDNLSQEMMSINM